MFEEVGAQPAGHGPHRYFFVVPAVDVPSFAVDENATPAFLGCNLYLHTLANIRACGCAAAASIKRSIPERTTCKMARHD